MSLKVVSVSGFANVGMGDVRVYGAGVYDTLFIFTNNSNDNARNTVASFQTLAKYYGNNGIKTLLYGTGTGDTQINPILRNLSIAAFQCNPIVMWLRGSQLDPAYLSSGKYYSPADLDQLMRNNPARDRTLDSIPLYGSTPASTPATGSTTTTTSGSTTPTSGSTTPTSGSTTPTTTSGSTSPSSSTTGGTTTANGSTSSLTPLTPTNTSTSSNSSAAATPLAPISPPVAGEAKAQAYTGSPSQENGQMSAGSKAGISVGVIGGVALIAAIVYWYYVKKRNGKVAPKTFFE